MKTTRKTTCDKCGSTDINITWRYNKEEEMNMYLGHDGYGFQFEDAEITCAKCKSSELSNVEQKSKREIK